MQIPGKIDVFGEGPLKSFQKPEFIDITAKPANPEPARTTSGTIAPDKQIIHLTKVSTPANSQTPPTSGPSPELTRERETMYVVERAVEISDLLARMVESTKNGKIFEVASDMRAALRALQGIASINNFTPSSLSALNTACLNVEVGQVNYQTVQSK